MMKLLQALKRDERGVSAIEYAILAGVIVVVVAAGVTAFHDDIQTLFNKATGALDTASKTASGG